jgi:4-amino-4-deoxy-L-arabinose transferase-like glycosyltransferase
MFEYHEQPPLYGGLIAVFFKLFGDSIYTERLFCFSFLIATYFVIVKLWKLILPNSVNTKHNWLPVVYFSIIPVVFWAFQNHVEETVMTLFDLTAVYFIYYSIKKEKHALIYLFLSAFFIYLASLTKGLQGLFPLSALPLSWLINRDRKKLNRILLQTIYLLVCFVLLYLFSFLIFDQAYSSFEKYFSIRLINTFNHVGSTTDNRFYLLFKLFEELSPVFILTALLFFLSRKKNHLQVPNESRKICVWLLLIGISGSLPLMVTLEQRGFYLVTSLPFYCLAFALLSYYYIVAMLQKAIISGSTFNFLKAFTIVLFFSSCIYFFVSIGKTKRDKELLHDVYLCKTFMQKGEVIGIPEAMWNDWNIQTYMVRHHYISLSMGKTNKYYIIRKDLEKNLVPKNYTEKKLPTKFFDVYELIR